MSVIMQVKKIIVDDNNRLKGASCFRSEKSPEAIRLYIIDRLKGSDVVDNELIAGGIRIIKENHQGCNNLEEITLFSPTIEK